MNTAMLIADRESRHHKAGAFTLDGKQVNLVAIQRSRRTTRKGRDLYIYRVGDCFLYNFSPNQPYWSTTGSHVVDDSGRERLLSEMFASKEPADIAWMARNSYEVV